MMRGPVYKPHDPKCTCVTDQYECWNCRKPKLEAIGRRMTQAEHEYDRLALSGWRSDDDHDDGPGGCSCHINPPCNFCTSQDDEDEGATT